jgi:hypothetical protein
MGYSPLPSKQSEQVYSMPKDNTCPFTHICTYGEMQNKQNTKFIIGYRPATDCTHTHTESCLVSKERYWVYISFCLVMKILDVKLFTIKSKNVKQSLYRPGEAPRVPAGCTSRISRQSAHEDGKVVSPTHWPPLPPRKYFWYSFLLEAVSTPGP